MPALQDGAEKGPNLLHGLRSRLRSESCGGNQGDYRSRSRLLSAPQPQAARGSEYLAVCCRNIRGNGRAPGKRGGALQEDRTAPGTAGGEAVRRLDALNRG